MVPVNQFFGDPLRNYHLLAEQKGTSFLFLKNKVKEKKKRKRLYFISKYLKQANRVSIKTVLSFYYLKKSLIFSF